MIEATLEQKCMEKITTLLNEKGLNNFTVIGSLQDGLFKAHDENADMIVVVKLNPRSYSSPTIPVCQIEGTISITLKADVDYGGQSYIEVCDILLGQFEVWQKCLDDAHDDFSIDGEFQLTGFQMGSGNTGIDADKVAWNYNHNFTLFGVVL